MAETATMLQATLARVKSAHFASPILVANEDHRHLVKAQLDQSGVKADAIILEPEGRNTAAAVALVAHWSLSSGIDEYLLVMPSDHVIAEATAFQRAVEAALPAAHEGRLVTFGIAPTAPETGYGYIEAGSELKGAPAARIVRRFIEKPDLESAAGFVASGNFYWNSGMFLFKASAIRDELQQHAPDTLQKCAAAMDELTTDGIFVRPEPKTFLSCGNISIDYAVMERTDRACVVPVEMGWSDVGSWQTLWGISAKDGDGNVAQGNVVALDTHGSLLRSECDIQVAALGLRDMVVVATRDAILVSPRERSQDVKLIVDLLKEKNSPTREAHAKVYRPWGSYETVDRGDNFQVKRLVVKPGGRLSLQLHHRRSEHWVVVSGTAEVTIGNDVSLLNENESAYVPMGVVHRLANPGTTDVHLIEVQSGDYLGEDDIVRLEDHYGRT